MYIIRNKIKINAFILNIIFIHCDIVPKIQGEICEIRAVFLLLFVLNKNIQSASFHGGFKSKANHICFTWNTYVNARHY